MTLAFDGQAKIVTITASTTLNVKDLWSRWVDWLLTSDNSKYPLAMSQVGGDVIDQQAGTSIPAYIYLLNGWKIRPMEADHTLKVTEGILLTVDSSDPFIDTEGAYTVRVNYQQPVQAITVSTGGGGGLTQDEHDQLMGLPVGTLTTQEHDQLMALPLDTLTTEEHNQLMGIQAELESLIIEGQLTFPQAMRLMLAVLAGKSTGGGTPEVRFRDLADAKDRIIAAVDDDGNRTAMTRDAT